MARKSNAPARSAPSGPGRFSKRDENVQPIREPDIDSPDLQYGDRQQLTEAQQIARLREPGPGAPPGGTRPTGEPVNRGPNAGGLPPWLIGQPSAFPNEAVSTGLPIGPGPGPEALESKRPAARHPRAGARLSRPVLREPGRAARPRAPARRPRGCDGAVHRAAHRA